MRIFNKIDDLIHYLNVFRRENKRIGFVPTMGALHDGHLSLLEKLETKTTWWWSASL